MPDLAALNLSFAPSPARIIPPYLHLVHGLSDNPSFTMIDYICFTAALKTLNPEFIFLHYRHDLTGWWWETWLAEVDATKGTELRMLRERDVTSVWGRKVTRTAHKADVIRLEALRYYGGVYIDADVLIVRDLAPLYNVSDTVMALEASRDPRRPEGLCNAVILAKPYAPFIVRWQGAYRTFQSARWNYHSVVLPLVRLASPFAHQLTKWQEIARAHPSEIKILTPYSFFWPLWTSSHLSLIHEPSEGVPYSFSRPAREQIPLSLMMNEESGDRKRAETEPGEDEGPAEGQYAYHLWSSIAWDRHLKHYTPDSFFPPSPSKLDQSKSDTAHHHISSTSATPFVTLAARWVSADLRDRWRTARELGQV